jgi:kynurenine formamidase
LCRSREAIGGQLLERAQHLPGLEHLNALDRLPPTGATLIALPIPVEGGSGGPVRVIALVLR